MAFDKEFPFLSHVLERALEGGVLIANQIKRAYEAEVRQGDAKTTIYRMPERHGRQEIMPGPRHRESDVKAREGV